MQLRTRFAPSPTGLLHVGNAYSALLCQQWAEKHHAQLLLRIEDIDHTRCRAEFCEQMVADLRWLGLRFDGETVKQSERHERYRAALAKLQALDLVYPCFCTRKHIQQEIERMGIAPHAEDVDLPYPGTCRSLGRDESQTRMQHEPFAWRIDMARAVKLANELKDEPIGWRDQHGHFHPASTALLSDTVIGRKDIGFSYHLAAVVDDAAQKITHIIRGEDLLASTPIHTLLQRLLGFPTPVYTHHALLTNRQGERLAKRNSSTTLKSLHAAGCDPLRLKEFLLNSSPPAWLFAADDIAAITQQLGIKA